MPTLEEIQLSWAARWKDKPVIRPTCYNRPNFDWIGKAGCSCWFDGGNAEMTAYNADKGGILLSWLLCNGCKQKKAGD